MKGGSLNSLYYNILILTTLGYGYSFLFDYILITFFSMMKEEKCPCQKDHRKNLTMITYPKLMINILFYFSIIYFSMENKTGFQKLIKKLKNKN
jgi:hypothetical protein